jgi:ketosteroid isomerase-like protein
VCDQVAAGTGKGSGLRTDIHYGAIYSFSDGRIREIHEYATTQEALEAAGLSE